MHKCGRSGIKGLVCQSLHRYYTSYAYYFGDCCSFVASSLAKDNFTEKGWRPTLLMKQQLIIHPKYTTRHQTHTLKTRYKGERRTTKLPQTNYQRKLLEVSEITLLERITLIGPHSWIWRRMRRASPSFSKDLRCLKLTVKLMLWLMELLCLPGQMVFLIDFRPAAWRMM